MAPCSKRPLPPGNVVTEVSSYKENTGIHTQPSPLFAASFPGGGAATANASIIALPPPNTQ